MLDEGDAVRLARQPTAYALGQTCDIAECPHNGSFTPESQHSIVPQYLMHRANRVVSRIR